MKSLQSSGTDAAALDTTDLSRVSSFKVGEDTQGIARSLGVIIPDECEIHFVVRPKGGGEPVGGKLLIHDGTIIDRQSREPKAGTVATSWPGSGS